MFRSILLAILFTYSFSVFGQLDLNIETNKPWYNDSEIVLPLSIMAMGIMTYVDPVKLQAQSSTIEYRERHKNLEDYLQFGPSILQATANILKLKGRHDLKNQIKYFIVSEVSTLALVYMLKISINEKRPNGGKWSFPSGHTAQGFASATILYQQYKDSYPILAYSGYSMAIATGALRVVHNKHWINDVLFGAGLGILVPNLVHRIKIIGKGRRGKLHSFFTGNELVLTYRI